MISMRFTLFCLAAVILHTTVSACGSRYHSAKCIQLGAQCSSFFETRSCLCKAGLSLMEQSDDCKNLACRWCTLPGRADQQPCTAIVLRTLCNLDMEEMMPTPTPMPTPVAAPVPATAGPKLQPGSCTYMGDKEIVVDLGQVVAAKGWTPATRDGLNGLVYRSDLNMGIVQPAMGEMCFPVSVQQSGDYYLTAVSYAPHRTEHNDMWVRVDKPLRLWKNGQDTFFDQNPNRWVKAYQNNGIENGMAAKMWTKDHDPHRFIVRGVEAGENVRVCIAGRSFRYEVYRIVMKKCFGNICMGGRLFLNRVLGMPLSKCM